MAYVSPNAENYTLGRGIVYFNRKNPDGAYAGERDLGNVTNFSFSIEVGKLEHYSSRSGLKTKDKVVVTEVKPKVSFTLDEISVNNLALQYFADTQEVTQAADTNLSATFNNIKLDTVNNLNKRNVFMWVIEYEQETANFNLNQILKKGTNNLGTIVRIIDNGTTGSIYLSSVNETNLNNVAIGDTITDDGTTPGSAKVLKKPYKTLDVVAKKGTTFLTKGTDYILDANVGKITFKASSDVSANDNITVIFSCNALTYTVVNALKQTEVEGYVKFVSDNPVGTNFEVEFWRVNLQPAGNFDLIGDDWMKLTFEGDVLKDESGHPDNPYFQIIIK